MSISFLSLARMPTAYGSEETLNNRRSRRSGSWGLVRTRIHERFDGPVSATAESLADRTKPFQPDFHRERASGAASADSHQPVPEDPQNSPNQLDVSLGRLLEAARGCTRTKLTDNIARRQHPLSSCKFT